MQWSLFPRALVGRLNTSPVRTVQFCLGSRLRRTVPCLESDATPEALVWFPGSQTTFLFYKPQHNPTKHYPDFLCVIKEFLQREAGRWPPCNSMDQVYLRGELLCHHLQTCNGRSGCDTLQPPNCLISCTKPSCNPAIFSSSSSIPVSKSFLYFFLPGGNAYSLTQVCLHPVPALCVHWWGNNNSDHQVNSP